MSLPTNIMEFLDMYIIEKACPCNTCSVLENVAFNIKCCEICDDQVFDDEYLWRCKCNVDYMIMGKRRRYARRNGLKIMNETMMNYLIKRDYSDE